MIRLLKLGAPQELLDHADEWLATVLGKRAQGIEPSKYDLHRYNTDQIKAVLIEETGGKCAYCESDLLHIAFGDIEHIIPKKMDDTLRFQWDNLTLACSVCNNRKRAHLNLVDPYEDEPSDFIGFAGAIAYPKDTDGPGDRTLTILGLNRGELREKRSERIAYVEALIGTYLRQQDSDVGPVLKADFVEIELDVKKEFAAAVRAYVQERAPEIMS